MLSTNNGPSRRKSKFSLLFALMAMVCLAFSSLSLDSSSRLVQNPSAPTASIADALFRRGMRRFFTKRFRDAKGNLQDEDDMERKRRNLKHVSRRSLKGRSRGSRGRGRGSRH
eukprot:TRINITY_DN53185_c0_g1_i1.p1 TRINITY_DN53185_c0_g1~~TRINITY_DN53185_c0_g1_i1.p1  ORF type:complete len:113 (-),score=7.70 TRINITY_DN53185_c0_g1_i1:96-434(-)